MSLLPAAFRCAGGHRLALGCERSREVAKIAVAGHAEQDNLHAIRSAFNTVITRPESGF